ncbi:MAG: hypothetical protein AAEJ53_13235 [Myxococcota bacterium]
MSTRDLDRTCEQLEERYGAKGGDAAVALRRWLGAELPFTHPEVLAAHLREEHLPLLFDAFWQLLPFGTGGRRGRMGYGQNRMNETTLAMTVQGHCDYLRRESGDTTDLQVVVANDVRVFRDLAGQYAFLGDGHPLLGVSSRSLGEMACSIYAGNGITAWFERPGDSAGVLSTPSLSYLIAALETHGGINLSASHNPPDDNGVKTYDAFGSQPVAPEDQRLIDVMARVTDVRRIDFAEAVEAGLVRAIPEERHQSYVDLYVALYEGCWQARDDIPITFTPLCGVGGATAGRVLEALGFAPRIPPDQGPDGGFGPIPFHAPNPEVAEATLPAREFAESQDSEIVLSCDPDADRVGLEIRLADGSWFHFDGNQIAAILGYFLMLDPEGPQRRGLVIETLVTTKILGRIVEEAGNSQLIDDLLVGFKYVADVLKRLGRGETYQGVRCDPEQLVLAAEESHGVIMLPGIRDKDGAPACMYLAALHQRLRAQGRTLLDYYTDILESLGAYDNLNRSIVMQGAEGVAKRDAIMGSLRANTPSEIAGEKVLRALDFADEAEFGPMRSESDRTPRNVVQFQTRAFVVTVRPSGTEPKLKFYCQLLPGAGETNAKGTEVLAAIRTRAEEIAARIYNELLARIDASLGPASLQLPDIVDLDRKIDFERETIPALREALGREREFDALLAWLGEAVAPMTPGSDALPAVRGAVTTLCEHWQGEVESPLLARLADWAR